MSPAYSRSRTPSAPCWTRSEKHLTEIETSILVFVSGVEMWKVTPSKSEITWSIEAGVALYQTAVSDLKCDIDKLEALKLTY
jgi:hypothetical protein